MCAAISGADDAILLVAGTHVLPDFFFGDAWRNEYTAE
jgi:hypothetical protein